MELVLATQMENAWKGYGPAIMRWGIQRKPKVLDLATTCWMTTLDFGIGKNTRQWVRYFGFTIYKI